MVRESVVEEAPVELNLEKYRISPGVSLSVCEGAGQTLAKGTLGQRPGVGTCRVVPGTGVR